MKKTVTLLYDRIRWEEKAIINKMQSKDISTLKLDAKNVAFELPNNNSNQDFGDIVLQRCISHFRGLHASAYIESAGIQVINSAKVAEICGNKFYTSLALSKSGVPTPKTVMTFTPESALTTIESMGYPVVLKPLVGSWGRLVVALRDQEEANAFIELQSQIEGALNRIFYIQEMVKRPPRDIRCIVVGEKVVSSVYRIAKANDWKTNVARGGSTEPCPLSNELEDMVLKASKAVGGGVLGVDAMEGSDGLVIHEINSTVEFRGAQNSSTTDIAEEIVDYTINQILE